MLVEFHPEAVEELLEAKNWYEVQSINLAKRFVAEIEHAITHIQKFPLRWRIYKNDVRWFHIHRFPFSIIYRATQTHIQVLAVMHQRRKPFYWKNRLE